MSWRKPTNNRLGTETKYGAADINKIIDLLNGTDTGQAVNINNAWTFTQAPTGAIVADNSVTNAKVAAAAGILYSKLNLGGNIADADISTHTSTKITISDKTHLPNDITYNATVQTLTNKVIDAGLNTLDQIVTNPMLNRTGWAQPKAATLALYGSLADHGFGTTGTIANVFDTTEGVCTNLPTTAAANVQSGLVNTVTTNSVGIGRRLFGMKVRTRCKPVDLATNSRFYFGFTSNGTLPITDTPLGAAEDGIVFGWNSADTYYTIRSNDGSGVNTQIFTGNLAKDAVFHTIEINWTASGNPNVIFDGTTVTVSTKPPRTTVNLFFNQVAQTTASATAKTQTIHGTWFESDK